MIDFAAALKYAKLVQIAGTDRGVYESEQDAALKALGYTYAQPLWGTLLGEHAPFGFVYNSENETVMAFRGTDPRKLPELIGDADAVMVPFEGGGMVHQGFASLYGSLENPVIPTVVCGHSLGGALATLLAVGGGCSECYTFGSPRVGSDEFAARYATDGPPTFRFENWLDPIPNLPPNPPYDHVGTKIRLRGTPKWNIIDEHVLSNYIELLEKEIKP